MAKRDLHFTRNIGIMAHIDAEELGEYCACAFCAECHFIEIESHE